MKKTILLTGATGYIGGRLLGLLVEKGYKVRCLARKPEYLARYQSESVEVIAGDVMDTESLNQALANADAAYYLVHSMGSVKDFVHEDRIAAENFARAATLAGVRRVIYLGGLAESTAHLSAHLQSRQEVGDLLRRSDSQIIEFRASVVIGSGSLSFELVRALSERLPVMILPKWVQTPAQPIAIGDLLQYLLAGLDIAVDGDQIFEIGGAEVVSYEGLMREYCRQRGLKRWMIRVPVLTPRLSSLWLGLVTPVYARVGRKLIDSMTHPTIVTDHRAAQQFGLASSGVREAIAAALVNEDREFAQTRWFDSLSSAGPRRNWAGVRFGSRLIDARSVKVDCLPSEAFSPIRRLGGKNGYYYGNWLWRLRGLLDMLVGGVGMRRYRRDEERLEVGDALDFWRVATYEPDRKLRLSAEMKVPGRAWLELEVLPCEDGNSCTIQQTAIFDPVGLFGLAYWYALYPVHQFVFSGMLNGIAAKALQSRAAAQKRTLQSEKS